MVAGLRSAQVVLLCLCAYLFYATAAPLLAAEPVVRDVRLTDPEAQPPDRPSLEELSAIWKRTPFGRPKVRIVARPIPLPRVAEKVATAESVGWQLMTTAAATPAELSVAGLVSTKDGKRKTIRVGDDLAGRTVIDIQRRRVVLSRGGTLEQLEMASDAKPAAKSARNTSRRASQAAQARKARRPRTRLRRPEPVAAKPPEPPPGEKPAAAPQPTDLALFFSGRVELGEGEEIVSVNGVPLGDAARLPEMAEALAGGAATLQVRGADGSQRDVSVEAAQ